MSKILKLIMTIFLIIFLVVLVFNVKVSNIDIVGNEKISDIEVAKKIFEKPYDNISIVLYFKDKFMKKKQIPIVSNYEIEWQTPFSITINILENPVIGFVRKDLKNIYFDKNGNICEVSNYRRDGIIEVIGLSFKENDVLEKIQLNDEKLLNAILNISSYLKENNIKAELLEINNKNEIHVYIGNIEVNLGNVQNMEIKLQRLVDIYPKIADYSGVLDLKDAKDNMIDEQYIFKKNN